MNNVWISTDLHLYSRDNDVRHPFRSKRNIGMLSSHFAEGVQEDDVFIFLGDLCDPDVADVSRMKGIIQSIPCKKYMCRGNHDTQDDTYYLDLGFDQVCSIIRIHNILFSHKPIHVAPDEINIHGHIHTAKMSTFDYNHINAYASNWNDDDHPVSLDDLLASATVQDYDPDEKDKGLLRDAYKQYSSFEGDEYGNSVVDLSEYFNFDQPIDESMIEAATEHNEDDESEDMLDEILFPDVESTKYWMTDDLAYAEKVERREQQKDDTAGVAIAEDTSDTLDESWVIVKENLEINLDQWAPGNPLWITGASGDGKSTLAQQMADEYNAEIITSDIVLTRMLYSRERYNATVNPSGSAAASAHKMNTERNSPAMSYVLAHPNLPYGVKDQSYEPEMVKFYMWLMEETKNNPKYNKKLYIIEGCDIAILPPDLMVTKPLIIVGGSRLRSFWRRVKRDVGEGERNIIQSTFKYIKKYKSQNLKLDDHKDNFRAAIEDLIAEAVSPQSQYKDVKKIVDAIPKEEHHYFYHGDTFKDSPYVKYRKVIKPAGGGEGAFIDVYSFDDSPDTGVVVIAADPKCRGHHVTDQLVQAAIADLPEQNITKLVWRTDLDNPHSYDLAIRNGFTDVTKKNADQYRLELVLSEAVASDPSWPKITAKVTNTENPNDQESTKAVDVIFYNDEKEAIGEASVSAVDTNKAFLYNVEVYKKYRGQKYANSMMKWLLDHYKITVLTVTPNNAAAIHLYEKFGFKRKGFYNDNGKKMIDMRLHEAATKDIDPGDLDRTSKTDVAEKYGLRNVGNTHEAEYERKEYERKRQEEKAEEERVKKVDKVRKTRAKNLKKARFAKKKKRFIKNVKSHLPGVKNEEADAVDSGAAEYLDGPSTEIDWEGREHRKVFNNYRDFESQLAESATPYIPGYTFEMVTPVYFNDPIDEAAIKEDNVLYPVYVIIMHTGTTMSKLIKGVLNCEYSHSSISFNHDLDPMFSFGQRRPLDKPDKTPMAGFIQEKLSNPLYQNGKVHFGIYVVPSTKSEVKRMKKRLKFFTDNDTKFRYDFSGLFANLAGISNNPQYRYFCSRFVADILDAGNPKKPYMKDPSMVRPEDFKNTDFAHLALSGDDLARYDKKKLKRNTEKILKQEKMRREKRVNESVYHLYPDNPWEKLVLNYQLTMMDEGAVDGFIQYLKSFKIRLDNEGNVLITRREYDQLDTHFRESLRMIKTYESAGNVEGVKEELCKINYMITLINEYYLKPNTKNLKANAKDVRKDMMDLRSVMMNAFKQHLAWVTIREPRWNFQRYYDNSKYGKNVKIPSSVISQAGRTIITALT